jgi:hypothetical protein
MPTQAHHRQIEADPLKCLPKMAAEGLLVERAEAGQIRKVDASPKSKHRFKQRL